MPTYVCICLHLLVFACICLYLLAFACICLHCGCDSYVYVFKLLSAKLCFPIYISFATFIKANKAVTMARWQTRLQTKKRGLHVEADSYVHNMLSASTPFAIKTTTNTSIVFKYLPSRLNNNFRYSPQSSYRSSRRIKRQQ